MLSPAYMVEGRLSYLHSASNQMSAYDLELRDISANLRGLLFPDQETESEQLQGIQKMEYLGPDTWVIEGINRHGAPLTTYIKPVGTPLIELFRPATEEWSNKALEQSAELYATEIEREIQITKDIVFGHMPEQGEPTLEVITLAPNSTRNLEKAEKEAHRLGKLDEWQTFVRENYLSVTKGMGVAGYMTITPLSDENRAEKYDEKNGPYINNRISPGNYSPLLAEQLAEQMQENNFVTENVYQNGEGPWFQSARVLAGFGFNGSGVGTFNHEVALSVMAAKYPGTHQIDEIWEARGGYLFEDGLKDNDPYNHLVRYYCNWQGGQLLVDENLEPIVIGQQDTFMNSLIVARTNLAEVRQRAYMAQMNSALDSPWVTA